MTLLQPPSSIDVPLRQETDGSIRIGQTRVLLELVIRAYLRGATPEGILESYPSLRIDEVYAVVTYYLQNKSDIDAYIEQTQQEAEEIRKQIEASQPDLSHLRTRLLKHMEENR